MTVPDKDEPSFGLSGSIIQERQRLLEEKLNRSRQNSRQTSNLGSTSVGQPQLEPTTSSNLSGRQGPQQYAPVHINPNELPPDSRSLLSSYTNNKPEPSINGTRLVPRPLPGFSTSKKVPESSISSAPSTDNLPQSSLIPDSIISYPSQRKLLVLIAFFLQLSKYAHLYMAEPLESNIFYGFLFQLIPQFLQWFVADALLLGLVALLRVPGIDVNFRKLIIGLIGLQLMNIVFMVGLGSTLSFLSSLLIGKSSTTLPTKPEESQKDISTSPLEIGLGSQKEISREELLLGSSHLLGRYTVKILPDSIVKMNPDGESFCLNRQLDKSYDGPVHIPIYINGTNPFKLKYTFTSSKGQRMKEKEIILVRFARDHLVDADAQLSTGIYMLPADLPGRYYLESVMDKDEYSFRQGSQFREVVVAPCPRASFTLPEPSSDLIHCLGSAEPSLQITASGIAPFQVTYSHQVNSSEHFIRHSTDKASSNGDVLDSLALVETNEVFPLELNFQGIGLHHYRVVKVQDRFNNLVAYEEPAIADSSMVRDVNVYAPPVVRSSCDLGREYFLSPKHPKATIPIHTTGIGPFTVKLGVCPIDSDDSSCFQEKFDKEFMAFDKKFTTAKTSVPVTEAGLYRIISLSDKYCSTTVESTKSCIVSSIPKPTLSINYEPIISTCQFKIGLEVTLVMSGQPPFDIKYREIVKLDNGYTQTQVRHVKAPNLIHHLKLTPELSGSYNYQFYELSSDDYGTVAVDESLQQVVKALPNAKFVDLQDVPARTCVDWPIHPSLATVQLSGEGPWTLNYSIFHKGNVEHETLQGISDSKTELKLPAFTNPGRYTVQLSRISDGGNCYQALDTPPLIVDVRGTGPNVAFNCDKDNSEFWALKGQDASLPIRLSGDAPWKVEMISPDNTSQVFKLSESGKGLPAKLEGDYKLVSVQDSYCPGSVLEKKECTLKWHPLPTFDIIATDGVTQVDPQNYIKRGICQGVPDNLGIEFTGRAPWNVEYSISFPGSNELPMDLRADVTNETSFLVLETLYPGSHVYTFSGFGDGLYPHHQPNSPLRLEQDVFARPSTWFTTPSLHQCSDQEIDNITIELSGQAPFDVVLEWRDNEHQSKQLHLKDIPHSTHRFSLEGRGAGSHSLRIVRVTDSNGCLGGPDLDSDKPASLSVDVVAPPTILPASRAAHHSHACIGERLGYVLGGISPWVVHYSVNGTERHSSQTDSQFRRLIDTPGVFHVNQVCHLPGLGASCCFTPTLPKVEIHPLPGAWLAGGSDQYVNIHDGERTRIQVDLAGTPPFKFTYTRRDIKTRSLLETQSISDVNSLDYFIETSLEGIFEVISVQDRYCQYPFSTATHHQENEVDGY